MCILAAAPVALAGFFHYNGMTLEQFLWAVVKSEFLFAGGRPFASENFYYNLLRRKGLFSDDRPQAQVNAGGRSHGDHSAKKLPGGQAEEYRLLVLADFLGNFDLDKKSPHILAKI